MKKALALIFLTSIAMALILLGCGNDGEDVIEGNFNGSDAMVQEFRIGNVSITAGGTFDVPLAEINLMTFVLDEPVDPVSFVDFLDLKITIYNRDTGKFLVLTKPTMLENGSFYISEDNMYVEYRLLHYMDRVWIGGVPIDDPPFASPGDTLEVKVDFVAGKDLSGKWWAFKTDMFKVIYTSSTP